ncbi:nitrite reductase small subunit NirD [bacterium]|nr:nitrite reductase small subunit NirD [bacterium]
MSFDKIKICKTNDVPVKEGKAFLVGNDEIAIFRHEGHFYAIDNVCPHQGAPLAGGEVRDGVVICPFHGWQFKVSDGQNPSVPELCVKSYPVMVEGDDIWVMLQS